MLVEMLPLLVFTTFSGLAAGAYAIDALCGNDRKNGGPEAPARPWLFPLVCLVLLSVGLCGTLMHLGQPFRFANGMANPGSMIAQEAYWSLTFGLIVVVDLVLTKTKRASVRPVCWAGALVSVGLMVVTGLAYYQSLGLPAWSGAATVPLFLVGDLALGAGLCALLNRREADIEKLFCINVAAQIAFAAVLVAYGLHLARIGIDFTGLLVASGMLGPVGVGVVAVVLRLGKLPSRTGAIALFLLTTVSVVIARFAFFAAGML
ncbi:MAG: DmsC/YnfH family molybdoenzyme membrane anchor subunit [Gordonibacter sp.]|uniref:DmsC/YnfH family molybdoenzyme membrane anchor subunit n=1 Tax=Gordonibacter sp. TaxID=1968902 RepID=UPI002FCACCBD